jgi:hypothetical protein
MNETNVEKPRVLACIEVQGKVNYYDLIFTEKKMMVAKTSMNTGMYILWMAVLGVCFFIGLILCGAAVFTFYTYPFRGTLEFMDRITLILAFFLGSVLIFGPYSYIKWRQNKQHKRFLGAPESILSANKKNFEITYDDIIRVEIHPETRLPRRNPKINVVTATKQYKFLTTKKVKFEYYMDLLLPILPGKVRVHR